jgi:hypothetical protein
MHQNMRIVLLVVSAVQLLFGIGFFFQVPALTSIWPYQGTTPLTFIFFASIFAAAAASTTWVVLSGQWGALVGIALDYIVILAPLAVYSWLVAGQTGNSALTTYGFICMGGVLFGVWLWWWSRRLPMDTSIPMPPLVRWSFLFFVVALVVVSVRLILQHPNVIPWTITPELSVVIGWMFLGAAVYFIYGFLRPSWANAAGQLMGFLAYDVVLIVPFLTRLPATAPEFQIGLWLYTGVVLYSGILAFYFLFVHPPTRVVGARATPAMG